MGWPQIMVIVLITLSVGTNLVKHGEPRKDRYNVIAGMIGAALWLTPLHFGGFFQ